MFLKVLKDFLLKRTLKKSLFDVKNNFSSETVKTVGILVDITYFDQTDALVADLLQSGIEAKNIKLLLYKDKIKKNETYAHPDFSMKDVTWNGEIIDYDAKEFLKQEFDLLISYYDIEKAPLLLATNQSKARFKAGFARIDKRLNHFMIDTIAENHVVFIEELFRYLKILNKI